MKIRNYELVKDSITNPLKEHIDKGKLKGLLGRFRSEIKRDMDRVLADEIQQQILESGDPIMDWPTQQRLARWCNTTGSPYQDAMPIAQQMSMLLFGIILDRKLLNT
jgi:hypothetical protein